MRLFNTTSSWKKEWKRTTTWSQTSTLFLPYVKRDVNGPPWGESDPHDFAVEGIWKRSTDSWGFLRAGVPPARDALSHGKDDSSHHGCVGEVDSAPMDKRRCPFYSLLQGLCSSLHWVPVFLVISYGSLPSFSVTEEGKRPHPTWKCLSGLCSWQLLTTWWKVAYTSAGSASW